MRARLNLPGCLRDLVVTGLHVGHLHSGDRLPSIREVAAEFGVNPRTAAKAYRILEHEGLAEIRGRSGVFVAHQEHLGPQLLPESARWMAALLAEAHRRRLCIPELHDAVRRCTVATPVRCALVESVVDTAVAFGTELEQEWGFDTRRIHLDLPQPPGPRPLTESEARGLRAEIHEVSIVAVTSFLAPLVRPLAEEMNRPLVLLTIHQDLDRAIHRHLERVGRLTVVAVDPRFVGRVKQAYGKDRIHGVLVQERGALARLDRTEPILLTRAAHEQLGLVDLPLVFPHSPTLSAETDRQLADLLIRCSFVGSPEAHSVTTAAAARTIIT
jgi:GntR family transcriptional regulator